MPPRHQIPALTGLRFVAALSVALGHATGNLMPWALGAGPQWYSLLANASGIGMPLFFVLSGFVIFYNYSESVLSGEPGSIANFFIARFARLYPLYALAIGYDLVNSYSYYQIKPFTTEALPYFLTMTSSWVYVMHGDRSLAYTLGPVPQVAWSVSTEWFFYLVFPLICPLIAMLKTHRARLIGAVMIVALGFAVAGSIIVALGPLLDQPGAQDSFYRWLLYFSPYSRIFEFALGCAAASIFMGQRGSARQGVGSLLTAAACLWTALWYYIIFGLALGQRSGFSDLHMSFGFAPGLCLLIYCCARYDNAVVRALGSKWMALGGEASYSLYLLHTIIIGMFASATVAIMSVPIAIGDAMRMIVCLVCCVGASLVTWTLIEVPARRALRRLMIIKKAEAVQASVA